ncbi:MAG: hypothetical protein ACP5QI_08415, partial [Candidatus Bathyarchaeia archaeon]
FIYKRTREERRRIRERAYYKYLRDGSLRVFPFSMVEWNNLNLKVLHSRDVNLLMGLIDGEGLMKGPGILKRTDRSKNRVLIYSRITCPVERIEAGLVMVREDGCEKGQLEVIETRRGRSKDFNLRPENLRMV